VAESGAIAEYLIDTYGNGRLVPPAGTEERRRWTYFLHYAEGSAMAPLLMKLIFDRVESSPAPFFVKPIAKAIAGKVKGSYILPQIAMHLDYLEAELSQRPWFAGSEFSAADIQMSFPLEAASARGGLNESRPQLAAFLKCIHSRPAFQRALERGGPYELLK
jgi:glutathione S-transferase